MLIQWHRFWTSAVGAVALVVAAIAGAGQLPGSVFAAPCNAGPVSSGGSTTVTFCYTGGPQSWTVPAGVTGITVTADGAQGGDGGAFHFGTYPPAVPGANGNEYEVSFRVTPGDVYTIEVGGAGQAGDSSNGDGGANGYNSGADGNHGQIYNENFTGLGGGGGGGATAIWNNSHSVLYLSAGGGGGGGGYGVANASPVPALGGGGGGGGGGYSASGMANGANGVNGSGATDGSDGSAGPNYCKTGVSTCAEVPVLAAWVGDGQLTITYPPLTALPTDTTTPTPPQIPNIIITLPTTTTTTPTPSATPTTTPTPTPGNGSCEHATAVLLSGQWTLVAWPGKDGISVAAALSQCTDITSKVAVVWGFDASTHTYEAYFPSASNVPGANDLTSLAQGSGYWVALNDASSTVQWEVATA